MFFVERALYRSPEGPLKLDLFASTPLCSRAKADPASSCGAQRGPRQSTAFLLKKTLVVMKERDIIKRRANAATSCAMRMMKVAPP